MGSPAVDAADDLDALADAIADLDLGRAQPVALDDEDAVDAVAVLQRVGGHRQHVLDQVGDDVDAREAARLEAAAGVGHAAFERKGAGLRVDRRAEARDLRR